MLEMEHDGAGHPGVEGAVGDRNGGVAARAAPGGPRPDPELVERATRRRFTAEYKLAVLREADGCTQPGEVGALLRREGLYSSHAGDVAQQRDAGSIKALARPRGRKPADRRDAPDRRPGAARGTRGGGAPEGAQVIEVQGNVSALLGQLLDPGGATGPGSTER